MSNRPAGKEDLFAVENACLNVVLKTSGSALQFPRVMVSKRCAGMLWVLLGAKLSNVPLNIYPPVVADEVLTAEKSPAGISATVDTDPKEANVRLNILAAFGVGRLFKKENSPSGIVATVDLENAELNVPESIDSEDVIPEIVMLEKRSAGILPEVDRAPKELKVS